MFEFICPTRRSVRGYPHVNTNPTAPYYLNITEPTPTIGRSDYAANGGDQSSMDNSWQGPATLQAGDNLPEVPPSATYSGDTWSNHYGTAANGVSGVIYRRSECFSSMIKDGTTYTYLAGEKYVNPDNYYTANQIGGNFYCGDNKSWDEGFDYDTIRWTGSAGGIGTTPGNSPLVPKLDKAGYSDNSTCDRIFGRPILPASIWPSATGRVARMNYQMDAPPTRNWATARTACRTSCSCSIRVTKRRREQACAVPA